MRDLAIIGAGGFGRETIDLVNELNRSKPTWRLIGVFDDAPSVTNIQRVKDLGTEVCGGISSIPSRMDVAVAIGNPYARAGIVSSLTSKDCTFPTLIHPSSLIGSNTCIEAGTLILGASSIGNGVTLRQHVHLNPGTTIGHDVYCSEFVSVNPNATVSGDTTIGRYSLVGAGAVILQGLTLQENTTVGAGAVVTTSVSGGVVKGVPAR